MYSASVMPPYDMLKGLERPPVGLIAGLLHSSSWPSLLDRSSMEAACLSASRYSPSSLILGPTLTGIAPCSGEWLPLAGGPTLAASCTCADGRNSSGASYTSRGQRPRNGLRYFPSMRRKPNASPVAGGSFRQLGDHEAEYKAVSCSHRLIIS